MKRLERQRLQDWKTMIHISVCFLSFDCFPSQVLTSAYSRFIVHRPALVRRLTRLENKLKFQPHERFVCEGVLKKAEEVHIIGTRVQHQAQTLKLDKNFKIVSSPTKSTRSELKVFDLSLLRSPDPKSNIKPEVGTRGLDVRDCITQLSQLEQKTNGKSIWEGRDGEEVTVEIFALRHYEERGFKGYVMSSLYLRYISSYNCLPGFIAKVA